MVQQNYIQICTWLLLDIIPQQNCSFRACKLFAYAPVRRIDELVVLNPKGIIKLRKYKVKSSIVGRNSKCNLFIKIHTDLQIPSQFIA